MRRSASNRNFPCAHYLGQTNSRARFFTRLVHQPSSGSVANWRCEPSLTENRLIPTNQINFGCMSEANSASRPFHILSLSFSLAENLSSSWRKFEFGPETWEFLIIPNSGNRVRNPRVINIFHRACSNGLYLGSRLISLLYPSSLPLYLFIIVSQIPSSVTFSNTSYPELRIWTLYLSKFSDELWWDQPYYPFHPLLSLDYLAIFHEKFFFLTFYILPSVYDYFRRHCSVK